MSRIKYKFVVNGKWKYETLEEAKACAERIFARYGVFVSIVER